MGRLEKIVVVTVLFLVAVILGYSLSTDPSEPGVPGPVRGPRGARRANNEAAQLNKSPEAPAADAPTTPNNNAPAGLMSTATPTQPNANGAAPAQPLATNAPVNAAPNAAPVNATPPANAPAQAQPATPATPAYIVTKEGLAPTASDDFMTYTWKAGDSFKALATKYYGSPLHVARLRVANEGKDETKLVAGDQVLISVTPTSAADRIARPSQKDEKSATTTTWSGGLYTVKQGDVLGVISSSVYGSAKHWKKIYDANRDVIGDDPNKLKVGMQLRIPQN